jgi:hypothetical protein
MQSALGIDEPDSGVLLDDMFFADGGLVPSDRFIGTRIEAELAFIMKHAAGRAALHHVRRAQRHRFRGARAGNSRYKDRAGRSRKPNRRGRSSIPSPTTPPMPASCSAAVRCARWMPTCAGSARCAIATANWKKPGLPPACSIIPRPAWRGSPTRSRRSRAGAGSGGAGRIVHSPDRDPQGRHDSSRLWPVWHGQLLLRLIRTAESLE